MGETSVNWLIIERISASLICDEIDFILQSTMKLLHVLFGPQNTVPEESLTFLEAWTKHCVIFFRNFQ